MQTFQCYLISFSCCCSLQKLKLTKSSSAESSGIATCIKFTITKEKKVFSSSVKLLQHTRLPVDFHKLTQIYKTLFKSPEHHVKGCYFLCKNLRKEN